MATVACRILDGESARGDGGVDILFEACAEAGRDVRTIVITQSDAAAPYLTRKGWQVSEQQVAPDRVAVDGPDLLISLDPQLARHVREYTVLEIALTGTPLTGRLVWSLPVIAGAPPRAEPDMPEPESDIADESGSPASPAAAAAVEEPAPGNNRRDRPGMILAGAAALIALAAVLILVCPWCGPDEEAPPQEVSDGDPVADRLYRDGLAALEAGELSRAHGLMDDAAARAHCDASLFLAQSYSNGPGEGSLAARRDPREALRYLAIACRSCRDRAAPALEELARTLTDDGAAYAADSRSPALEDMPIVRALCGI